MIQQLFGIHRNKSALVLGHGPSLNSILPRLPELKQKHVIFDTNEWYAFHSTSPHYWVTANNVTTLFNHKNRINTSDSTMIYASTVDLTDKNWIRENIKRPVYSYDQRHFQGMTCVQLMNSHLKDRGGYDPTGRCCKNITETMTIQEWLMYESGYPEFYSTGDTVLLHMVSLAILMECNPIFVIGFHNDYSVGYSQNNLKLNTATNLIDRNKNLDDLRIIYESAKLKNVSIFNLDEDSQIDLLPKKDFDKYEPKS